jgi:signal transduction histidine kinase
MDTSPFEKLATGSARLLASVAADSVVGGILALAREVIPADGYAVWRRDGAFWRAAASHGVSPAFTADPVPCINAVAFDGPVIAEDVRRTPEVATRLEAYAREGVQALMAIPLVTHRAPAGSIVFYYRRRHKPSDTELRVALALGQLSTAAFTNAELYLEQQRLRAAAEAAETGAAFLAEASVLLSSLDYEDNLRRLAALAVPRLGDWCAVDLLTGNGEIERLAVAHTDQEKVAFAHAVHQRYPTTMDAEHGIAAVLKSGRPALYPVVTDEMLAGGAEDPEHMALLRALELRSVMIVPLSVAGRTFGAISLISTSPGRYTHADLAFATELARRAAFAIENARLYREVNDANRLKDEFLATLSHELRTPLNVILGRIRMLAVADEHPSDLVRQTIETIERNGNALARLVSDLLDVSRITAGRVQLDLQPVHLGRLAHAVAASLGPAAQAKDITLTVDDDPELPPLRADGTRLQQVIWNLISNAIKFTPARGRVTVSVGHNSRELILIVRDTGDGIAPSFLPHVFEMFRQAEPTPTRRHGGLGLGLSIVRRLVEIHGGTVTASSEGLGRGAAFTVRLPFGGAPAARRDPA